MEMCKQIIFKGSSPFFVGPAKIQTGNLEEFFIIEKDLGVCTQFLHCQIYHFFLFVLWWKGPLKHDNVTFFLPVFQTVKWLYQENLS